MKFLLTFTFLLTIQLNEPNLKGNYNEVRGKVPFVRHIPTKRLKIKGNGKFELTYSITSISSEKIVKGYWVMNKNELNLTPKIVIEPHTHHEAFDKRKIKCKDLFDSYFCEEKSFVFSNDTLFIDQEPFFVKD